MSYAISINNISKTFKETKALDNVSMNIEEGDMIGLIGASGSGKSTLLRQISGLITTDKKNSYIKVFGETVQNNGKIGANIRKIRSNIGFIFQQFNLVERLTVMKNVLVGHLSKMPKLRSFLQFFLKREKILAMEALHRVNMSGKAMQRASTLSGGQQQRVAIARAIMQKAKIILADEPIASLDPQSAKKVMKILSNVNHEDNVTVVVSLHQVDYALKYCKKIIALKEGRIVFIGSVKDVTLDILHMIYGEKFSETGFDDDKKHNNNKNDGHHHVEDDNLGKVKAFI